MIKLFFLAALAYSGAEFARVGDLTGDARIWRYGEEGAEWLTINNIVGEGDEILTYDNSFLEIEFSDGSVLTLSENTSIYVERVEDDRTYFTLNKGVARIYARDRVFGIITGDQNVYIKEGSVVRVEKDGNYFATSVLKGIAQVGNQEYHAGSEVVIEGGRYYLGKTGKPDRFDRWAEEREKPYYYVERVEYIPVPYYAGIYHLSSYGEWVYIRPYGWVWAPRVSRSWRPYCDGHWVFRVGLGWVWVSYEPWGWVPYRYGCWTFVTGYGWLWIPGGTFVGGCVEWYYGPNWIGWAPLDYYGRPIVVINDFTIVNVVHKRDFDDPIYRYKPPKGKTYKGTVYKPYKDINAKEITKFKATQLEKPVYVKDVQLKKDVEKPIIFGKPTVNDKNSGPKEKGTTSRIASEKHDEIYPEKPQKKSEVNTRRESEDKPYIEKKTANPKFKMEGELKETRPSKPEKKESNTSPATRLDDAIYPEKPPIQTNKDSKTLAREEGSVGDVRLQREPRSELGTKQTTLRENGNKESKEIVEKKTTGNKSTPANYTYPTSKSVTDDKPQDRLKLERRGIVDDNNKNIKGETQLK